MSRLFVCWKHCFEAIVGRSKIVSEEPTQWLWSGGRGRLGERQEPQRRSRMGQGWRSPVSYCGAILDLGASVLEGKAEV